MNNSEFEFNLNFNIEDLDKITNDKLNEIIPFYNGKSI